MTIPYRGIPKIEGTSLFNTLQYWTKQQAKISLAMCLLLCTLFTKRKGKQIQSVIVHGICHCIKNITTSVSWYIPVSSGRIRSLFPWFFSHQKKKQRRNLALRSWRQNWATMKSVLENGKKRGNLTQGSMQQYMTGFKVSGYMYLHIYYWEGCYDSYGCPTW